MSSKGPTGLGEPVRKWDQPYRELLKMIHGGFNGKQSELGKATIAMQRLKHETTSLMQVEVANGETCGPPFWFVSREMSDQSSENHE